MKKRTVSLVLVMAMMLVLPFAASAANSPSVTNDALYNVGGLQALPGVENVVIEIVPETPAAVKLLEEVTAAVEGDKPVVSAFFAEQTAAVGALLPAGTDLDALQLKELAGLRVSGYTADMGPIAVKLAFPTLFEVGKPVVVMVGLVQGEEIVWEALLGTAQADGSVLVTMPGELLVKVQAGEAVVTVLQ